MSTEEEYNKLIADKLNARSFESSEQDWNEALSLIEAHDKKKKRRFLFWIIPGAGLLITGLLWFTFSTTRANDENIIVKGMPETENPIIQTKQYNNNTQNEKVGTEDENNNALIAKQDGQRDVVSEEQKHQKPSVGIATKTEEVDNSKEIVSEKNSDEGTTENKQLVALTKKVSTKKYVSANERKQKEKNIKQFSEPKNEKDKSEEINHLVDAPIKKETDPVAITSQTTITTEIPILNSVLNNTSSVENKDSVSEIKKSFAKVDSVAKTEKFLEPILPSTSRFEFYALGSIQYTPVKDPSQKLMDKLNPMGGLYFVRSFVNGVGFGSGLFYSVYSANTLDPKIYRSVSQEFGYKALVIEITPDKFHYARIPLFATYSFKKNRIFFGVQASYMLMCRSVISSYNESYKTISDQKTERTFGYTNGINKFDVSLMCAYSRPLYQKFSLGIGMDYGFKDTKDNSYFGSNNFERNISFQLLLTYKIR